MKKFTIQRLRKLREDVAALELEASGILEGAASREGDQRGLQEPEQKKLDGIKAQLAKLRPLVAEAEDLVEGFREAAEAAEERRKSRPRLAATEAGPPASEDRPIGRFNGVGDYISGMALTTLAQSGTRILDGQAVEADERILELQAATGRVSSDVPQEGNLLVGLQYSGVLLSRAWQRGELRQRCSVQDIGDGFDGVWLPYVDEKDRAKGKRYGGIDVYWAEDGVAVTETKPTGIRPIEIRVKSIRGRMRIPEKLLRDATALGSYIMRVFPEEFAYRVEDAILNGDGKGKPLGILNSAVLLKVAKEGGQPARTIVAENVIKAYGRFKPRDRSKSAIFVNQELMEQLPTLNIAIGTSGQLIYMPPGGLSGSPYGSVFGLSVIPIEQAKGAGKVGDFGFYDGSEYLLVMKPGLQMAQSLHFYFDTHDLALRWEMELNGQPELDGPIKPENASDANFRLSPFVAIAERA